MPSQAFGFGELLVGAVLMTMGISGHSVREVLAGKASKIKPLGESPGDGGAGRGSQTEPSSFVTAGSSVNPLPGWSRSRIDQGVDFYGGQRIAAPEAGTVLKTGAPGWPEGGGVLLHTISGKIIYFYEGLDATVHAGERVVAGQQIAMGRPGGSIEVGFANANGEPLAHGEYSEGVVTKWGRKAAEWLNLIGAPR